MWDSLTRIMSKIQAHLRETVKQWCSKFKESVLY